MAVVRIRHAKVGPAIGPVAHDAMIDATNSAANPPAGLIVHAFGEVADGEWQSIDVWESIEAADRFEADVVDPKVPGVLGADAVRPGATTYELHSLIRG